MALDLTPSERQTILEILHAHLPAATVWVFGSRATGTARKTSDLDLLILDPEPLSLSRTAALRLALSESALPFFVDLVDARSTSKEFLDMIKPEQKLLQEGSSGLE